MGGEFAKEKICCHEAFAPEPERRPCHIPWAQLEHLKTPENDHDTKGPPRLDPTKRHKEQKSAAVSEADRVAALEKVEQGNVPAQLVPPGPRLYCYRGPEGMAAHAVGQIYWQPWDPVAKKTKHDLVGKKYYPDFDCEERDNGDLDCKYGNWGKTPRVFQRFFKRAAYHLFFSTHRGPAASKQDILKDGWLISEMYRRSLASS